MQQTRYDEKGILLSIIAILVYLAGIPTTYFLEERLNVLHMNDHIGRHYNNHMVTLSLETEDRLLRTV